MSALESLVASMTLAELARLAGKSVEEVVALACGGTSRSNGVSASRDTSAAPTRARPGTVPRGGLRVDHVLAAVESVGGPAKAEDVRAKVGGSVTQVRSALQKLAKAGKVRITGERRGTRYIVR